MNIYDIAKNQNSDLVNGLSLSEVQSRLQKFGLNKLLEKKAISPIKIFFEQFNNFIIWILIGAALVSGFLKEWVDALAIIALVILNAILGFIQEYRAEKSLAALKNLSSPNSKVIRSGQLILIPSTQLVPGDLIEIEAGDHVPADSRISYITPNFAVLESSLTGESTPVEKTIHPIEKPDVPLADRANMVYMGTTTSSGKARALVVNTGMSTELGKIAGLIQNIERSSTPLQKKLEAFGKWIVYLCFALVGLVFLMGLLRGGKILDMFLTSVSLAVAAIPEGLPAVVTVALALGVQRMVKRHALIRKLPSVETLGCATVICSDKTGTLTKNEMTVQAVYTNNQLFSVSGIGYAPDGKFLLDEKTISLEDFPDLKKTLEAGVLCNASQLISEDTTYKIIGDPTEGALLTAAAKANIWKNDLEKQYIFSAEIPFDPNRKIMSVLRKKNGELWAFVKGAPDVLLKECHFIQQNNQITPIQSADHQNILKVNTDLANQAMRVLAVAVRKLDINQSLDKLEVTKIETNLVFLGLVAMIDPPREEVKKAMKYCHNAGIRTIMITGDHKNTATAIARELGFFAQNSLALTGEELDKLSEKEFTEIISNVSVYARVSPEHKLRIVKTWKAKGEIVAMTGDGVNDAPAVKEADIGVAMGITGTDVTKEVSDMIVTDDNFASIVAAVEEGRGIYDNIKKFIHYLLSCNAGEILVMFTASVLGLPVPLLPIHILWVNFVTDGLPALALGVDPVDPNIMKRPPYSINEAVITKKQAWLMLMQGIFIAMCSLSAFSYIYFVEKEGLIHARTAAFIVLSCSQLFHSLNCRNQTVSIFKIGLFTNIKLIWAILASFILQMAVVYIPFCQTVFKTHSLGLFDWTLVLIISSMPLWAMEIYKKIHCKS
ncbi:MAG: calcium-transporting P-type ATPase, PMR1-type [Candidatus Omnitrophica bacterium]|nr:calcium-transporting P-type ATPase, PMR1-type [Candidatus Omnitrophota bacterium]